MIKLTGLYAVYVAKICWFSRKKWNAIAAGFVTCGAFPCHSKQLVGVPRSGFAGWSREPGCNAFVLLHSNAVWFLREGNKG